MGTTTTTMTRLFTCDRCAATTETDGGWAEDWVGTSFPVPVPGATHYELRHRVWCGGCIAEISKFVESK